MSHIMGTKSLLNEGKNWKNDPWGAREELAERMRLLGNQLEDIIQPRETAFFYDKSTKHINAIGKQITMIEKALVGLELALEQARKVKNQ